MHLVLQLHIFLKIYIYIYKRKLPFFDLCSTLPASTTIYKEGTYFSQHFFGKVIYDMAKISWSFEGICQIFESAWPKVKFWHLNIFFLHRNLVQLTAAQTIRAGSYTSLKADLWLDISHKLRFCISRRLNGNISLEELLLRLQ